MVLALFFFRQYRYCFKPVELFAFAESCIFYLLVVVVATASCELVYDSGSQTFCDATHFKKACETLRRTRQNPTVYFAVLRDKCDP